MLSNKHINCFWTIFLVGLTAASWAGVPKADLAVLDVDFNNKTPGSMLGENGAAQQEPVDLSLLSGEIIEDTPGENFLRVENNSGNSNASNIRWEFLDATEFTEGIARLSFQLTPLALERYSLGVRESGGSSRLFLSVTYTDSGTFSANDIAGSITLANNTYTVGVTQNIEMIFDMDAGTSEMVINGDVIYTGRQHGITDRGVGRLLMGYSSSNTAESFNIDNISVTGPIELPLVLDVNLEDKMLGDSIGTGGAELGEPVTISSGLITEILDTGMGNQALLIENPFSSGSRFLRWELMNNAEALEGMIAFEIDVTFNQLNDFQFLVREASGSSASFTNLRFFTSGDITISDSNGSVGTISQTYQAGQLYRIRLTFDIDEGTYSIWLNDDALIEDRAHGVSNGSGVGSFITAFQSNSTANASFVIDDLQVGVSEPTFELIFEDGFE